MEYRGAGTPIDEVYATADAAVGLASFDEVLRVVPARALARVSSLVHPDGVLGVARRPVVAPAALRGCHVVLAPVGVQDPGNLGTLVRSAVALAPRVGLLQDPASVDIFGPKCVRAASGALRALLVAEVPRVIDEVVALGADGFVRLGLVPRGGELPPWETPGRFVLLVGAEGPGLDEGLMARCDRLLTIPLRPGVDSLNAAVAGSIALAWLLAAEASSQG